MIGEDIRQATPTQSLETLLELQRQDVAKEHNRSSKRVGVQCRVELKPGNSRERSCPPIVGACSDLSTGGCKLITEIPPSVGDVFWVCFEKRVDIPSVFARCVRCRLLREDAFECGFQFFSDITLPNEDGDQPEPEEDIDVI